MHDMDDKTRLEVLGEVMMDELKAIREYVADVSLLKQKLGNLNDRVDIMEQRLTVLERVVRAHESDIRNLQDRKHRTA
jgi:hypothetical protein